MPYVPQDSRDNINLLDTIPAVENHIQCEQDILLVKQLFVGCIVA